MPRDRTAVVSRRNLADGNRRMGEISVVRGLARTITARLRTSGVRAWRAEAGKDFDDKRYVRAPHAHSLYVNTLAERGAIGFAALTALLLAWLAALLRHRRSRRTAILRGSHGAAPQAHGSLPPGSDW